MCTYTTHVHNTHIQNIHNSCTQHTHTKHIHNTCTQHTHNTCIHITQHKHNTYIHNTHTVMHDSEIKLIRFSLSDKVFMWDSYLKDLIRSTL